MRGEQFFLGQIISFQRQPLLIITGAMVTRIFTSACRSIESTLHTRELTLHNRTPDFTELRVDWTTRALDLLVTSIPPCSKVASSMQQH